MNSHNPANSQSAIPVEDTVIVADEPSRGAYVLILVIGALCLWVLPQQAAWIETKRGWFTQPMVGPALGLSVMTLFAALRLYLRRNKRRSQYSLIDEAFSAITNYRVPIFAGTLFFLYVNAQPLIGFVPATLIFVCTLLWLSRLLDWFWFGVTLFTVAMMVMIFRVGVSLWLPDVWLYEFLPETWADFANRYL